jgi:hypothetical protein
MMLFGPRKTFLIGTTNTINPGWSGPKKILGQCFILSGLLGTKTWKKVQYPPVIQHNYWKLPFIVDLPITKWWFPIANCWFTRGSRGYLLISSSPILCPGLGPNWSQSCIPIQWMVAKSCIKRMVENHPKTWECYHFFHLSTGARFRNHPQYDHYLGKL